MYGGVPKDYYPPIIIEKEWATYNSKKKNDARGSDWKVNRFDKQ